MNVKSQHQPLFSWGDNNNGADYDKYFNIFTFACENSSRLWYMLSNLSNPPSLWFTDAQYEFISGNLLMYMRYTDPATHSQMGTLTPRSLTSTLLFSTTDPAPDDRFMAWFEAGPTRGNRHNARHGNGGLYTIVDAPNDKTKALTYHIVGKTTDKNSSLVYWFYDITSNGSTEVNIYPTPGDRMGWAGLLLEWLNGTSGDTFRGQPVIWCYANNTAADGTSIIEVTINPNWVDADHPHPKDSTPPSYSHWLKKFTNNAGAVYYGQADNFMARFGIMPDSPLFTFFINNNYQYKGNPVDTDSFKQLVGGSGGNAGGWVGFLAEHKNWGRGDFTHLVKSKVGFPGAKSPQPCKSNSTHGVLTGIVTALSIGMMIILLPVAPEVDGVAAAPFLLGMQASTVAVGATAIAAGAASGINSGMSSCP